MKTSEQANEAIHNHWKEGNSFDTFEMKLTYQSLGVNLDSCINRYFYERGN